MKQKLLLADDNRKYCLVLREYLDRAGAFEVLPYAHDGEMAVELIEGYRPNILILDMVMPKLDGIGVLRRIRELGLSGSISVFANSSFIDDNIVRCAQELGVVYFFAKPLNEELMVARITEFALDGHRTEGGFLVRRDMDRERIILNYLRALGVPPHMSGYLFLKTDIDYCVERYQTVIGLTTAVYPYVAKIHDTAPGRVERNIRHAIEYAWNYGDIDAQHRIFGYTVNDMKGRPTNKEFIALITDRTVTQLKHRKL